MSSECGHSWCLRVVEGYIWVWRLDPKTTDTMWFAFNTGNVELDSSESLSLGMARSKWVIVCVALYLIYHLNTLCLDNHFTLSHCNSGCLCCRDTVGRGKKEMSESRFCNVSVQAKPTGLTNRHSATSAVCVWWIVKRSQCVYVTKFGAEILFQFLGLLVI